MQLLVVAAAFAQVETQPVTLSQIDLITNAPSEDVRFVREAVQAQLCQKKRVGACVERLVVKAFQDRGYMRASAKVQQITFANPARPQDFTAKVNVEPGKVYRLEKIEVMRNHVFSDAKLPVSPQLPLGKPVDEEQWEDFLLVLQNAYHKGGRPEPLVLPSMRLDESKGTVVLSVDIVDEKH